MKLSREYLTEIIQFYGFSECGQILSFLTYVCEEFPDAADLSWIYRKINQCLRNNSNGGDYLYALERLRAVIEIEFLSRP
ncbi:Uncharacterised protein [Enterobacter ludwigii]|nr:Uncharacterised protein [Enterobacter ludwigii]